MKIIVLLFSDCPFKLFYKCNKYNYLHWKKLNNAGKVISPAGISYVTIDTVITQYAGISPSRVFFVLHANKIGYKSNDFAKQSKQRNFKTK